MPNIRYIRLTLIWHTNNIPRITNSFRVGIPPCGGEIPRTNSKWITRSGEMFITTYNSKRG